MRVLQQYEQELLDFCKQNDWVVSIEFKEHILGGAEINLKLKFDDVRKESEKVLFICDVNGDFVIKSSSQDHHAEVALKFLNGIKSVIS